MKVNGRWKRGITLVLGTTTAMAIAAAPTGAASGGISPEPDGATVKGKRAKIVNGKAVAPAGAPRKVVRAIKAANSIEDKPYVYGGGHGSWKDRGYDCSGAVSYALGKYGAKVLDAPMPSGSFERWGKRGKGDWITVYAKDSHMYVVIAGLRWDTSQTPGNGPGWSSKKLHQSGYAIRHPRAL